MTKILIFFLIFCAQVLDGQSTELGGGVSKYYFALQDDHRSSNYANTNLGLNFFVSVDEVKFGWKELENVNFRFTLGINRSNGEFFQRSGGQAGGTFTTARTQKTVLTLDVYPFEFKLFKFIDVNIGVKYLRALSSQASGSRSNFGLAGNSERELDGGVILKNQVGPTVRVAYKIKISEEMHLIPQYHYYFALSKEFNADIATKRVQNHFLGIGIQQKF